MHSLEGRDLLNREMEEGDGGEREVDDRFDGGDDRMWKYLLMGY